jgi:hypothetical protein
MGDYRNRGSQTPMV